MTDILGSLNERELLCVSMRRDGMTYRQVGAALGVGVERARQLTFRAIRKIGHPNRGGGGTWIAEKWVNCRKAGEKHNSKYSSAASYEQVKALHKWQESALGVETACHEMESVGIGDLIDDLNESKIANEWRRKNGTT